MYRASLSESNQAMGGAGFRAAGPVALGLYGLLGAAGILAARHAGPGPKVVRSVALVLQEGPEPPLLRPAPPAPSAPAPPARPRPAAAPSPPPAPRPAPQPPAPASATAPETAPTTLPTEDHARDPVPAGAPGGSEAPGGGPAARIPTLDVSQVRVSFTPPRPGYPLLARKAGVQGSVLVAIRVGPDGVPISAQAADGPLLLRKAAEAFALGYRFEPYRVNGMPQDFRFNLTVAFTLNR
ncbi:MAG: energy transducer TonB [Holophaga sp.]